MDKFIFVCYQHGAGGERLSLKISQNKFCHELQYMIDEPRTIVYDYFDRLFLVTPKNWKQKILEYSTNVYGKKYHVVPSHFDPKMLEPFFPNSVFVVINAPQTSAEVEHIKQRIWKYIWQTKIKSVNTKIKYFLRDAGRMPTKKQIARLEQPIKNAEIFCMMDGLEPNARNISRVFDNHFIKKLDEGKQFCYQNSEKIIAISYTDSVNSDVDHVIDWLQTKTTDHNV